MDSSYSQNSGPAELPTGEPLPQRSRVDANTSASGNETMLRKKILIAVMGVTGAGKSTFIKTASGIDTVPVGHELTSCTANVTPYSFNYDKYEIFLIDTPGFNDTFKSETEVLKEIASWLEKTYRDAAHIKLSGIIYMHALEDRRMSGSSLRNLKMFRQLCGDQSMHNVIMVTSGWDKMRLAGEEAQAEKKEEELRTTKEFWAPMINKGARTDRFQYTRKSALSIIANIIPDTPVVLQIQQELVEDNKALVDTAAGATVNEELVKLQQNYENKIREVQKEMAEALRDRDEEMREILEQEREKYERMRSDALRAQDSLRYEQRSTKRRYDQEIDDLKEALSRSTTQSRRQQEIDQQRLIETQAEKIADEMEFKKVVQQMRSHMTNLRAEEREAVEQEIKLAEQDDREDQRASDVDGEDEDDDEAAALKAKQEKRVRRKKRAFKLCLNVVGIVGSVTMSALGLGFLNPFQHLIDFSSSDDA